MLNCENLSKAFDEILFSDFNLQLTPGKSLLSQAQVDVEKLHS